MGADGRGRAQAVDTGWALYHAHPHGPSGWRGLGTELPDHTADSEGRYNLILAHQPAVGGEEGFKVRVWNVSSLAELFWIFRQRVHRPRALRVLRQRSQVGAHEARAPTNPVRRQQVVAHFQSTGRWGWARWALATWCTGELAGSFSASADTFAARGEW